MRKAAKVAISLPQELLRSVEKERAATGETRSEFLRRAVEAFFRRQREREAIEQYIRGYQQYPETAEEVEEAEAMFKAGLAAMAQEPWDEGNKQ